MKTFLTLAALGLPVLAYAQTQTSDQPIIVTATRIATPATDVPADVTVLTQQDFAAHGDTTLAQALSTVPGVNLVQSGGPGNTASLFIRGTNSEDVLVLLDGVPVNDPSSPNGAFNFGTTTLADVERIEIVRGPLSGLYGGGAIGGVVNIITKRGAAPTSASLTAAGGWPAQGQASATISGLVGKFDYALSGALDEEAGFDATPKRMSVYAGRRDPYRSKLGALNLGYSPTPQTRIYAILRAQQTDAAFPDLDYPVFDDPDEFDYNTSLFGKLGLTSTLLDGRWHTDLFIAQLNNQLHYKNLLDAADPNQASADDYYRGYRTDAQWNNNLRLNDTAQLTDSALLFGLEYSNDTAHENVDEEDGGFTTLVHASQHTIAGHAGLQTTLDERFTFTAALREDSVSSFGNATTWRLGGLLAVPEWHMNLKASGGTGFLAPSLFDLHYVDNYGDSGNPNLRPETSTGWDAGPEFLIPALGRPNFADLSVTYFQSRIRNLITSVQNEVNGTPTGTYTEQNIGHASINGIESDVTLNPAPWLSGAFNYTYTRAVSGSNGPALLRRPQHEGSATLTFTPIPRLSIVPQVQYTGRFDDYLYDNAGYPAGIGSSAPGTIVNLNVSYRLDEKFTLFATGRNILGSRFEPTNGLQTPGASLLLGIRAVE